MRITRSIKLFFQSLTRGWDDSATWDLDIHLAELICPRLKRFKELSYTYQPWELVIKLNLL